VPSYGGVAANAISGQSYNRGEIKVNGTEPLECMYLVFTRLALNAAPARSTRLHRDTVANLDGRDLGAD
jgi:hypothetical protein